MQIYRYIHLQQIHVIQIDINIYKYVPVTQVYCPVIFLYDISDKKQNFFVLYNKNFIFNIF